LTWTHLSAAFPSTATRLWKVAVSTPIYFTEDRSKPDALFVVTINLGDFELLQSKQGANQIAVLVEAREGPVQGTILQHPLMDRRRAEGIKMEGEKYQIPPTMMKELLSGDDVDYTDPLAAASDGVEFAGPWIATMQPVSVPRYELDLEFEDAIDPQSDPNRHSNTNANTDLLVMVQYRLEKVIEPVNQMRKALLSEGAAAIASILVVTLTLWLFVRLAGSSARRARRDDANRSGPDSETVPVR
jgi:hypothetical protein